MADTVHTVTTAAFPAGAIVSPVLAHIAWGAALAIYERGAARLEALEGRGASDATFNVLMDDQNDAFDTMMRTPAPDIAAVARKLEIAIERESDIDDIAPAIADLRRLGAN